MYTIKGILIFTLFMIWIILFFSYKEKDKIFSYTRRNIIIRIIAGGLLFVSLVYVVEDDKNKLVKDAYINAINGKNPYEMEIKYIKKDTSFIPTDTIYVLKE